MTATIAFVTIASQLAMLAFNSRGAQVTIPFQFIMRTRLTNATFGFEFAVFTWVTQRTF